MSADQATLLSQLEKLSLNDPQKVLNCSERLLALDANLFIALHCKGVAQMQLGKYDLARQTFIKALDTKKGGESNDELLFHLGVAQYRLGSFKDALETMEKIPETDRSLGVAHLMAQCYYNSEQFEKCVDIYQGMLENEEFRDEQDKLEIITNMSAAYAALETPKLLDHDEMDDVDSTSDLTYNAACAMIEKKEYDTALALLAKADNQAREEHGLPPSSAGGDAGDIWPEELINKEKAYFNDVAAILVQKAFILQARGDETNAELLLKKVVERKPSSISTYAVACVNWAALKRHSDFFDTYQKLRHASDAKVQVKLTSKQRLYVKYNTALLQLNAGKISQCRSTVEAIIRENADSPLGPLAMTAALLKSKNSTAKAEAYLKDFLAKQQGTTGSDNAQLLMAQLYLEQGNLSKALKVLSEVRSLQSKPAYVATLAEGYADSGDKEEAQAILKRAVDSGVEGAAEYSAGFYLRRNQLEHAEKAFAGLLKKKSTTELLAGHAAALIATDPEEAYEIATSKLLSSAEVQSAKNSNVSVIERKSVSKQVLEEKGYKRRSELEPKQNRMEMKKSRVRKMRHPPKDGKLDGKPDPERWVPMADRPSVQALPPRRVKEMKKFRANEQEQKRKAAEKKKAAAVAESTTS